MTCAPLVITRKLFGPLTPMVTSPLPLFHTENGSETRTLLLLSVVPLATWLPVSVSEAPLRICRVSLLPGEVAGRLNGTAIFVEAPAPLKIQLVLLSAHEEERNTNTSARTAPY